MDILYRTLSVRWLCSAIVVLALPILACWGQPADTATGQVSPAVAAVSADDFIRQGLQLESDGHWADALNLYQRAIKTYPNHAQLIEKRTVARIHYDLRRRYADSSFRQTISSSSDAEALNVYAEVLLKIQSYYVDQPDWARLASFGLHSMKVALASPEFRQANRLQLSEVQLGQAVSRLESSLHGQTVRSRQDAYMIAQSIANRMHQWIELPPYVTLYEFTNGAIAALDPYSSFMSDSQYNEAMSQIEGNFVGLGVELRTHDDHLEIVSVIPDGPAHSANVAPRDRIVAVDGQPVVDVGSEQAADRLQGIEGSFVSITVEREGMARQTVRIQRRRVEIPSVEEVKMVDLEKKVGYIRLSNFQKKTIREFDAALWQLHNKGMQSLIVDVRGNPGGLLSASVEVANRFLTNGVIVSTKGRNPMEDYTHRAEANNTWRVPLVVLIDENSASASEIFAAAIRDHRRGTIVGTQSFGKGSVQGIFPLNVAGGGVRLTTAKFYSPSGGEIAEIGVRPDVEVQHVAKAAENLNSGEEDNMLRVAVQTANRVLAMRQQSLSRTSVAGR
jgi:carboxyl-terminal processing protease